MHDVNKSGGYMDTISEKVIRSLLEFDGYVTTATLADITGISVSSIKHNLNWVREELDRFNITLQSTPRKGFRLIASEAQRSEIFQYLEEEANGKAESFVFRKGYILDTLFQFPANYTIQLFSEELSVSRNMIQKDLEQIKEELAKFHVSIKKIRNQGVVLHGEEFNIRQAIVEHNNSKYWKWNPNTILETAKGVNGRVSKKAYTYLSDTYSKERFLNIQKILMEAEDFLGITITDIDFCRVIEYLAIMRQRVKSGNIIKESSREEELQDIDTRFLEAAKMISEKLIPRLNTETRFEIQFLAARIFVCSTCRNSYVKGSGEYEETAAEYLETIENMLDLRKLSKSKELVHEVSIALEQAKIRENYQILAWSDLHRDIQKQMSGLYAACMTNIFMVEKCIGTMVRQDDVAWIALLINNFINDIGNKVKVQFVHATTRHKAIYQKRKIEQEIQEIKIIECVYFADFQESNDGTLTISTVPVREKKDNLIEVTKHISSKDIMHIKTRLEGFEEKKRDEAERELLTEIYEEQLMIPSLKARTKEETIIRMSKVLEDLGYVEGGFCEKVLERESFCPTFVGKGIAIPHLHKECILRSKVVVAKMKNPITWQKDEKVDIIFLIANNFEESEKVQMLFKCLYDLIENEDQMEKIGQSQNESEMLKNILKMN